MLGQTSRTHGGIDFVAAAFREFSHCSLPPKQIVRLARAKGGPREQELAQAYAEYSKTLDDGRLLDRDTRLRAACEYLESLGPSDKQVELLIISGLDSPSPLEFRLIEALLSQAKRGIINLYSAAEGAADSDDFDKSIPSPWIPAAEACERLCSGFADAEIVEPRAARDPGDPKQFAISSLFRRPRSVEEPKQASQASGLRVAPADGAQQEAIQAARWAKQHLLAGAKPSQLIIASRDLRDHGPRLQGTFADHGIPLAIEGAQPLSTAPFARAVASLLRLATEDWRHADLLSVITLPHFHVFDSSIENPFWQPSQRLGFAGRRAAIEWLLRELLLPQGRRELMQEVNWLASHYQDRQANGADQRSASRQRERKELAACLAQGPLAALSELCESFASSVEPLQWYERLDEACRRLDYNCTERQQSEDDAGRLALEDAFSSLEKLREWTGDGDKTRSLDEAAHAVSGWMSRIQLDIPWRHEGRVRVLTAETAAGLEPEHLLLMGLDERSFPRVALDSAIPGGDHTRLRHSEEMLLFCKLLGAARTSVTLSYPAIDDRAQKLNPSSYLTELERLFETGALRAASDTAPMMCGADLRRRAVQNLLEGDPADLSRLLASNRLGASAETLCSGLLAGYARSHGPAFGPYEGVLASELAGEHFAARYGVEHHWSASQLENYAACPFRFYMQNVLRAEPLESLALEVDYRRRGTLLHDAMVRLHQRVNELVEAGQATSSIEVRQFDQAFREAVDTACKAISAAPHERAIAEVEAMQTSAWSEAYHRQHREYDKQWPEFDQPPRPTFFEPRFGPSIDPAQPEPNPPSTTEPFALDVGDERVLLTGQVDRIDVGRIGGQLVFNVIDFKTAKSFRFNQQEIEDGRLLQLVLYTIAVGDHLLAGQDATPWRSGYWVIQEKGFKTGKTPQPGAVVQGQVVLGDQWGELVKTVRSTVRRLVHSVRAARFPMINPDVNCGGRCEYRTVCRVAQARQLEKSLTEEEPPA